MSTDTALWQAVTNMPDDLRIELLHYAEFLLSKYPQVKTLDKTLDQQHGYGSWAGEIVMSEDFDRH